MSTPSGQKMGLEGACERLVPLVRLVSLFTFRGTTHFAKVAAHKIKRHAAEIQSQHFPAPLAIIGSRQSAFLGTRENRLNRKSAVPSSC
ncbi:MAG: hypothetical protein HQL44_15770 [Alphaproteobacteria bacterium]|nr:hypothetical protein [Alphaproteobacteria bacterium]